MPWRTCSSPSPAPTASWWSARAPSASWRTTRWCQPPFPPPSSRRGSLGDDVLAATCRAPHPRTDGMYENVTSFPPPLDVSQAYGAVDREGTRFLLGDFRGELLLLVLERNGPSKRCVLSWLGPLLCRAGDVFSQHVALAGSF